MASSGPTKQCVSCGRAISADMNICPYCGHDFRTGMAPQAAKKKESAMPIIGGALILLGGIGVIYLGWQMWSVGDMFFGITFGLSGALEICGIITIVFGIIGLLGGIVAIVRKAFWLAIIGGVLTIPTIVGLIGLILVAVSKEEFKE